MKRSSAPELSGLVLAGGESRRMGRDKGAIRHAGQPQVLRAYALLERLVPRVYVSVRAPQAAAPPYADLPLVVDAGPSAGPATGLEAAWALAPGAAWLVLAVDLPRVDAGLLEQLIAARDPAAIATAFVHADGTPEPLCTIWEPAARAEIAAAAEQGNVSLRRLLETAGARLIPAPDSARLVGVNTPEEALRWGLDADHFTGRGDSEGVS